MTTATQMTTTVKVVQPAKTNAAVVRHVSPEATPEEVSASMCSCVVHLCGCK